MGPEVSALEKREVGWGPGPRGGPEEDRRSLACDRVDRDDLIVPVTVEEPSRAELLAAIQGSRVALKCKIETVAIEVKLLQADLRKVSDKVKVAERSIVELQMEVDSLRKQMAEVTSRFGALEARPEDSKGRSRRNNVCLLGFSEQAEGSGVEVFVECWIKVVLQPVGLPGMSWRWLRLLSLVLRRMPSLLAS
ncbi:hypothetical protein NDU88_002669 [Pleurodeles waltl]|uniref:Uncharacterized protein n=1 Tax=Pleurodeles waltl TaxID=8319 RepID=A0AAV7NEC7_PLEWA|nr:hypothetical protein NDU88_002669 [Pleurodeles waltl]